MQRIITLLIILSLNGYTTDMKIDKNSFQEVWNQLISDPLTILPQNEISFGKLSTWSRNIILEDAKRTLEERADILEPFDKLVHPNGICLKGIWEIYSENPYSGYFKNSSKALIIARASSAMSKTCRGEIRAFGLAGKLFPTMNPLQINEEHTANFFVIDDLGGTDAEHYTDVALTNEPTVTTTSEVLKNLLYGLKVTKAFSTADKNSGIRQVYEISELGERDKTNIITPRWMKIEAQKRQTVDAEDFRDELLIGENKKLIFDISVASRNIDGERDWQTIGTITFDSSVVSSSCDHRLHFHHPKWRDDLNSPKGKK
ncbi:hypothetical protein GSY74_05690 [Sulfurovum sp. bin170]|uniref:hypothetical protein n=1 Tax=Sulfurovum sp. bin170 TaxID=2695268 RepID=UPI0013E0C3AE|nr:hypothetical protein [Sulfurovum sp. bin170]NEW60770.1 hypothetical protein [Sulfurovum sp. bin170]